MFIETNAYTNTGEIEPTLLNVDRVLRFVPGHVDNCYAIYDVKGDDFIKLAESLTSIRDKIKGV